jgi:hypothetical protein
VNLNSPPSRADPDDGNRRLATVANVQSTGQHVSPYLEAVKTTGRPPCRRQGDEGRLTVADVRAGRDAALVRAISVVGPERR